ncbi:peptidase M23 [Bacteroidia bacterium]|nr:peptidase M23 [Bacteroidia bacterium]
MKTLRPVIAGVTRNPLIYLLFAVATLALTAQTRKPTPAKAPSQSQQTLEQQRSALLNEIEQTSALLNENSKSISAVQSRLTLVSKQITARKEVLSVLEKEINRTSSEIRNKERIINELLQQLNTKKEHYAISIRKMYKQRNNSEELLWIMSADHFSQSYRRMLYLRRYAEWRKNQAEEIKEQQTRVAAEKRKLETKMREKEKLAQIKHKEEDNLKKEETTKRTEVTNLTKNKKQLEAQLKTKQQQADALNRKIEQIITAEVEAARKSKTARKAETKGGFAMTKEEQTLSSEFANNKGRLPFPLKGNYQITEHFGIQRVAGLTNVHHNSNGIKIETSRGNRARAVFDGVVSSIFLVPGYQTSIILRHGNYRTLYANLEQVSVKIDDKVKTGQDLGSIYTDEGITALYFELWKELTKQNPEPWLNK